MNWMRLKKLTLTPTIYVLVLAGLNLFLASCGKKETAATPKEVRIGWQVAWATQGQIAMALQRTTALDAMGLKGTFKSFTYGAPLSEAALAGQLDVAFVGDQPAVNLLSRSPDWKIVARLMDFRVAIVVPPNSPIQSVADLKGKTLGIPFGASTHRVALQWLKEAGLDPAKDLTIINVDITEQSDTVKAAAGDQWPKVDAFASWDHHIALYEKQGLARILKSGKALGVVMMSKSLLNRQTEAAAFLAGYKQAYFYYATHQDELNKWFAEAAGGKFDPDLLSAVASIEPNLHSASLKDVRIDITESEQSTLQGAADFAFEQKLIKTPMVISGAIDGGPCIHADALVSPGSVIAR